ncbi:hypothetical protein ODZ84_00925 [Chryseobacterium fluminis]|uniref:hypothetical protein n=1 Tax=Chryseobacterium fluminis TaxID=2983606 RepID=UPI002253CFE7|nr:hypothetical protein [Chryseobacterium sp. MMS21-Ot14]UZT98165.1 hypothetical protein ODZ84_00925 [Chryseobacterium sp. MMS21-Ot14]
MITKYINKGLLLSSAVFFLASCSPDTIDGDGNGLTQPAVDASFTVTKTSENRYHLKAVNDNYINFINSQWNIDYDGFNNGKNELDIFLPDAGTYVVQRNTAGIGGQIGGTASQTIVVPTSDPVAGNIIQGGRFDTPAEVAKWTIHPISPTKAQWVFTNDGNGNGYATIVASGGNQQAFYQAVHVEAGQKYSIDMVASSATALQDAWFEVYMLNSIPAPGGDVSGTIYRNINTWDGCGKAAFGGKVSGIGCNNDKNSGIYTATATGTVYLFIKCGGEKVSSLSVDKVELRKTT